VVEQILDLELEGHGWAVVLVEIALIALIALITAVAPITGIREVAALAAAVITTLAAEIAAATRKAAAPTLRRRKIVGARKTGIAGPVCRSGLFATFEPYGLLEAHLDIELARPLAGIPSDHLGAERSAIATVKELAQCHFGWSIVDGEVSVIVSTGRDVVRPARTPVDLSRGADTPRQPNLSACVETMPGVLGSSTPFGEHVVAVDRQAECAIGVVLRIPECVAAEQHSLYPASKLAAHARREIVGFRRSRRFQEEQVALGWIRPIDHTGKRSIDVAAPIEVNATLPVP